MLSPFSDRRISADDLLSSHACMFESLYGDEPDLEVESEQAVTRATRPTAPEKRARFPRALSHRLHLDVFHDSLEGKPRGGLVAPQKPIEDTVSEAKVSDNLPGLLRLPVELRNQIYGYLFNQRLIVIKHNDPWPRSYDSILNNAIGEYRQPNRAKAIKCLRIIRPMQKVPQTLRRQAMKAKGISYAGIPGQKSEPREGIDWKTTLSSLLLTCKTISAEAGPILYGITTFYFDDARRLRGFLKTASRTNLSCITRLHIHVRAHGMPADAMNDAWEQEHIQCWTSIFVTIASKMTNLRAISVSLTVKNVTDGLRRAFNPAHPITNWKNRAGYMLMLQPLSSLSRLEDLRVLIRATDDIMSQYQEMLPHLVFRYWESANIHPVRSLELQVMNVHREVFEEMQASLEQAMTDVARSKDVNESFARVALATREYMEYGSDPIGYMVMRELEEENKMKKEEAKKKKAERNQKKNKGKKQWSCKKREGYWGHRET
ncbi:hypothetical protein E4T39_07999 [Aureobasidium subglaciale]|nr:hypothetical protein E4T39_07999 [Aureobasidium subglaciale]